MKKRLTLSLIAYAICTSLIVLACGQYRGHGDRVIVVREPVGGDQQGLNGPGGFNGLEEFLKLYSDGNGIVKGALLNFLAQNLETVEKFLSGTSLTPNDLIAVLFSLDSNHDSFLSPEEQATINDRIPTLGWVPAGGSITSEELRLKIAEHYPLASPIARNGIHTTLLRLHEPWAGGTGLPIRLTRQDLFTAGIIMGVISSTDFSNGIPQGSSPTGPTDQIVTDQLNNKLNAQIFARYPVSDHRALPAQDIQLEWMQLALRLYLADKLSFSYGTDERILPDRQILAFNAYGPEFAPRWNRLKVFYGSPLMAGRLNGTYGTIETFNLMTDLSFAKEFMSAVNSNFSITNIDQPENRSALESLVTLYPKTGSNLFRDGEKPRNEFWDGLKNYDRKPIGGDGNGQIDYGELALAFGYARVVDIAFALSDQNSDGLVSKNEFRSLIEMFNHDPKQPDQPLLDKNTINKLVKLYFRGVLDAENGAFMKWLRSIFDGDFSKNELTPYEFYDRFVKIVPMILERYS